MNSSGTKESEQSPASLTYIAMAAPGLVVIDRDEARVFRALLPGTEPIIIPSGLAPLDSAAPFGLRSAPTPEFLAAVAQAIGDIGVIQVYGRGPSSGTEVEALIAATYLDVGLEAARAVCAGLVEPRLEALATTRARLDPKTELQQRFQALGGTAPTYCVVDSGGPAHDRWFVVRVRLGDSWGAEGKGRSKRLAEREAARLTLAEENWSAPFKRPSEPRPAPDSRLEEA